MFGGGTVGYNIQSGKFVFGLESDLGYMELRNIKVQPNSPGGDTKSQIDGGFYATVTGRLGYATGNFLVYGKGGFALYDGKAQVYDNCNTYPCGGWLD